MADGITIGIDTPTDGVTSDTSATQRGTSSKRDTPPQGKKARKATAKKRAPIQEGVTTGEIEQALSMILSLPAMPCGLMGDEWAEQHFMTQGPNFAHEIAKQSERSPALRHWCEKLVGGEALAALVLAGVMYAMPPMMHWGLIPAPDQAKAMFGVPIMQAPTEQTTTGSNTGNNDNGKTDITGAV